MNSYHEFKEDVLSLFAGLITLAVILLWFAGALTPFAYGMLILTNGTFDFLNMTPSFLQFAIAMFVMVGGLFWFSSISLVRVNETAPNEEGIR